MFEPAQEVDLVYAWGNVESGKFPLSWHFHTYSPLYCVKNSLFQQHKLEEFERRKKVQTSLKCTVDAMN